MEREGEVANDVRPVVALGDKRTTDSVMLAVSHELPVGLVCRLRSATQVADGKRTRCPSGEKEQKRM